MDFQGLKVGDFLLNRECKRTRARVPVNAGYDVKPGTDQNKIDMIYYSFLIKSSINEMFLEISSIFRLKFKWNYILNLWLSN